MLYNDIRDNLKTGDIVLFSGNSKISTGIKQVTGSVWSHVGMVMKIPEYNMVLLWESASVSNTADVMDGKIKRGVQLVLLSDRIRSYDGSVAVRHITHTMTDQERLDLFTFRDEVKDRPYEKRKMQLFLAAYDGFFGESNEDLSSLFCSELVAETYQRMGVLAESLSSSEYVPGDFSSTRSASLPWEKGAQLSLEIPITRSGVHDI